jgi:hypothetical protein
MQHLPAMPTQEDLFGPEGAVKQLCRAGIELMPGVRADLRTQVFGETPADQSRAPESPQ